MDRRTFNSYIRNAYQRQTIGKSEYTNMFTMSDYNNLYHDVADLVLKCKHLSAEEIREILYIKSGIEEKMRDFILRRGMAPGVVVSYGTSNYNEIITVGNAKEVTLASDGTVRDNRVPNSKDTIYDLASTSKIFMTLSILKLVSLNLVSMSDDITKYAPEFKYLKGVTIYDLLTFRIPLITDKRVELASDKGEAIDILHNIKPTYPTNQFYSDMGCIVLKYVVEHATNMPYYDFIKEYILDKAKMPDTSYRPTDVSRVASTNLYSKILTTNTSECIYYPDGEVHDPKAQKLENTSGDLCGHAGMFSTASDMTNLAISILNGSLLTEEEIRKMTKNQTGKIYFENDVMKSTQYFGYLCFLKNPNKVMSEVYEGLSGNAFSYAGYTGTKFTVDPVTGVYLFLGSNRTHDRVTFVDPSAKTLAYQSLMGRNMLVVPNEGIKVDTRRFAFERDDAIIIPLIRLSMQYKMLEDICGLENNKPMERVRRIEEY